MGGWLGEPPVTLAIHFYGLCLLYLPERVSSAGTSLSLVYLAEKHDFFEAKL